MKLKTLFSLFITLAVFYANIDIGNCQWIQCSNGISVHRYVKALNLYNNHIIAGTYNNGIFFSTDFGLNWIQTSLNTQNVTSLTSNDNTIFAGLIYNCNLTDGVYLSTNTGSNWLGTSFNERSINCLNSSGNNIYAGCIGCVYPGGVYKSSDNGAFWQATGLSDFDVTCITISGSKIYVGLGKDLLPYSPGGLYVSTDEGLNWSLLGLDGKSVFSVVSYGNNIVAGTNVSGGVFISTDNGITWNQTSLNNRRILSLLYSDNKIIAGTKYFGIYLSKDNGLTWTQKNEGMGNVSVNTLLLTNGYLFAGTDSNSIWKRSFSDLIPVQNITTQIPSSFVLEQNYPNPFNPITKIRFDVPPLNSPLVKVGSGVVTLKVFNILGKEVQTLVKEQLSAGTYEVTFDGSNCGSGVYYYRIESGDFTSVKKMLMIK